MPLFAQAAPQWFTPAQLYWTCAALLVAVAVLSWLSNLFTLPGNWLTVGAAALFAWWVPTQTGRGFGWPLVFVLVGLAVAAEALEFLAGAAGAAKQGARKRSILLSLVGTLVGSIVGAIALTPLPLIGPVIGALVGGAAGAFGGAYLGERHTGRSREELLAVGWGALVGRLLGTVGKLLVGLLMVVLVAGGVVWYAGVR